MAVWVADVMVDIRARDVDRAFTYQIPEPLVGRVLPGHRVFVPFAGRYCQGFVLGVREAETAAGARLKPLAAVLDEAPLLDEELLALTAWMCERYVCTRAAAIHAVVPAAFRVDPVRRYVAAAAPADPGAPLADGGTDALAWRIWQALAASPRSFQQIIAQFGPEAAIALERLVYHGWVKEEVHARDRVQDKLVAWLVAAAERPSLTQAAAARQPRAPRQAALLAALAASGRVPLPALGMRPSDAAVRALVRDGLAHLVWESALRTPDAAAALAGPRPEALTPAQARAVADIVAAVQRGRGEAVVLFGVTGSGKTEVYLRAIAECLAAGGGAIVLVPEIALTPQMVARFVDRFGSRVAVLHSGLSAGEKRDEWSRIRRGEARIVVGARSAVFAPVQGLKLIIVDEEHEPSYKQEETPHYDARDVARWRAQYRGGVVVYGSATPSLEAMHEIEQGRARLLTLPTRVHGGPLPPVQIVDMREELRSGNRSIFSRALADGLERAVTAGHQAMLFLNRRGYAAFVLCRNCGAILQCPHCDISLTVHKGAAGEGALVCHYCGFAAALPDACPDCGEAVLRPFGIGTQQVEEAIRARWPLWRVARMDVDTTRRKGAHREVLEAFYRNELDVLVGTQMIAKGLDVPNVAFVGVVMADTMLAVPDFRAAERTFDLLTQVVGRAGRAEVPGETVIQTFQPDHYAILAAARHDYAAFYRQERALRERFFYPPFCELAVFVAVHADPGIARGAAARFERELRRRLGPQHEVLPAVPAAVPRVQNRFRYQVVIKYRRWPDVQAAVTAAYTLVEARLRRYGGACRLDVNAGRI